MTEIRYCKICDGEIELDNDSDIYYSCQSIMSQVNFSKSVTFYRERCFKNIPKYFEEIVKNNAKKNYYSNHMYDYRFIICKYFFN